MSKEFPLYAILLEDIRGYKEVTSETGIRKQFKHTTISKGSLIIRLQSSDVGSIKDIYNCLVNYKLDTHPRSDVYLFVSLVCLYSISGMQRDFMLGVDKPLAWLEMLGKLEWIQSLRKGSEVYVTIDTIPAPVRGVVKFIGGLPGEYGRKFGIELMERKGEGTNNGTFKGLELFKCKKDCGVFVSMDKLTTNETASAAKVTEAATSLPTTRDGLPVRLGDVVNFYDDGKQQHIGIVRWTGYDKSVCPDGTAIIGIEAGDCCIRVAIHLHSASIMTARPMIRLEHLNHDHIPHNFKLQHFLVNKNSNHSKVFLPVTFVHRYKSPIRKDSGVDNDSSNEHFEDAVTYFDNQPVSGPNKEVPAASQSDLHKHSSKTTKSSNDVLVPCSENAHNLEIGSEVLYVGDRAVIKWIGALPGTSSVQAGIEMIDGVLTYSSGAWDGVQYFDCKPGKGKFVGLFALKPVAIKSQDQTHSNVFTPSHSSISKEEQNPHNLTVGSAVQQGNPPNYGVIKWIGKLNGIEKLQAGVEMEKEVEEDATDGVWEGKKFFHCKEHHGLFVFLSAFQPDERSGKASQKDCPSQPGGTGAKPLNQSNRPAHSPTSQPNNHAHQNDNPHNLEEGSVVQYGDRPHYGVIKWIGKFPDHREIWFAGLDMEEVVENHTNGMRKGVQYFKPQPGRGKFMQLASLQPDQRFVDISPSATSAPVPDNIIDQRKKKAYQLALRDGKAKSSTFRLFVLGPENSGKTCLVATLFNESFKENAATQGVDVKIGTVYAANWHKCSAKEMAEKLHVRFWHNMNITVEKQPEIDTKSLSTEDPVPTTKLHSDSQKHKKTEDEGRQTFLYKIQKFFGMQTTSSRPNVHNLQPPETNPTNQHTDSQLPETKPLHQNRNSQLPEIKVKEIEQGVAIKITNENEFTAVVWDCAGQENYITTHTVFIRRNNPVFIVFKASCNLFGPVAARPGDPKPSRKVTHFKIIHYWLQTVTSVRHDPGGDEHISEYLPTVVLVITHIDQIDGDIEKAKDEIISQLAKELEGKRYAKHLAGNCDDKGLLDALKKYCIFLSNKAEFRNPQDISRLKEIVLLATAATRKEEHPVVYLRIEQRLLSLEKQVITTEEFHKIAMESGFMADESSFEMKGVLEHFNQMGVIMHYPLIDSLKKLVFLSPQWLEKLYAYLIIAHPYKHTGDDTDHAYKCLVKDGVLLGSFLSHMLKMFNKQQQAISCKVSYIQAMDYLCMFGFIAEINISTDFLEESHPLLQCNKEKQIFIVPSQIPEDKGEKKLSFLQSKGSWTIHFIFPLGFVPLTVFHKMVSSCINWNGSRQQDIAWLKRYEIMMVLSHGQFYCVSLCEKNVSIQLDIILEKSMGEDSPANRLQLIDFFQSELKTLCKELIPACPEVKILLPCPLCKFAHVKYETVLKGNFQLVCQTKRVPIPSDYYNSLFCSQGIGAPVQETSSCESVLNDMDRVTYAGLVEQLKDVNDWYQLGMHLLPKSDIKQLEEIHKHYEGNVKECKKALFIKYLELGDRSWNTVIAALTNTGYKGLATTIIQNLSLEEPSVYSSMDSNQKSVASEGNLSQEYKLFLDYYSKLVDTLPASDLSHYFVSERVISLADHHKIVRSSNPQESATLILEKVSVELQCGNSAVLNKMLWIMEQGIATANIISKEIRDKLLVKAGTGYLSSYSQGIVVTPPAETGYHSVEYEVFVRYFSRIVNSISAQTLSPHFVSRKIISHEDQIEILSVTSPRRAASLLLGRVSSAVEAGVNESFYRFLDILEQYGTPATKEILLAIKRDLSMSMETMLQVHDERQLPNIPLEKFDGTRAKDIWGYHSSCYLDATFYGLFAFSDAFDCVFLDTCGEEQQIRQLLKNKIVHPLRMKDTVLQGSIQEFRASLADIQKTKGVTSDDKDPENILTLLFKHILHLDPFLHIRRASGIDKEFMIKLFLEPVEGVSVVHTQQLLTKMFLKQNISFAKYPSKLLLQIPRYGKKFKSFQRIVPSLELDVKELCGTRSEPCFMCNKPSSYTCNYCINEPSLQTSKKLCFCDSCSVLWHNHPNRQSHRPCQLKLENDDFDTGKLQLLSVLCIETSHYVCFTRVTESDWVCFDSMAERLDNKHDLPGRMCTQLLQKYVYGERDISGDLSKSLPELVRRFIEDASMCIYIDPDGVMYQ